MELTTVTGTDALLHADRLDELYRDVFGAPPWNEKPAELDAFAGRLEENAARPGFRLVTAVVGGTVRGFGAGWPTVAPFRRDRAYGTVFDELGADQVDRHLVGAFEVDELAVHPASQGLGIGRAVLTTLCAGEPSWLLTSHQAVDTVAFYRRVGWQELPSQVPEPRLAVFVSPRAAGQDVG
ncbi:GCN5-related N-acetyltransferase [Kribbella flavida DSM 17836]|uniref:GCN5-related N-acetyltransferase n=1 Tax=Kribbella flavida (strain DSM 17836 / JCM 10339 / NBRC 14399) TaxID=479435 RepID=D2PYS5_KRIFD|nr:GNAT family N-acetyltransferase [Kribbella flavida]ADB29921.1 GCN5-related N-acetyltransferase [Kribbella flavida DSM 17836]